MFEIIWEQTGKRGGKFAAFKAWEKQGKPTWVDVQAAWRAYLLSERPVAGFVKDLSSWLNGRGHQQEWLPASMTKHLPLIETFQQRREREREQRRAEAEEDEIFGGVG